ncbi:hypothetical protein PFISCL1PPCAC_10923, partial [Pristionchus fissidentatus]
DGVIMSYNGHDQFFYVRFEDKSAILADEINKMDPEPWKTSDKKLAIYITDMDKKMNRVLIGKEIGDKGDMYEIFLIDTGGTKEAHRDHLFKMPNSLKKIPPQAVPVTFPPFSSKDLLETTTCFEHIRVTVKLEKRTNQHSNAFRAKDISIFPASDGNPQPLVPALKERVSFKKWSVSRRDELVCCFNDYGGCSDTPQPKVDHKESRGLDHTLLTVIIIGSVVCAIVIVTFLAMYLYKRFGHVISERHRRHHHGHRRHRDNSDGGSTSKSSQIKEVEKPPAAPTPVPDNENVLTRLPQYNIVNQSPHHTQVNRTINPLVMENSGSPNRAATPLKTVEISTQTALVVSNPVSKSAETFHDDSDIASNRAEPSDSRQSAGSSPALSEATLRASTKSSLQSAPKSQTQSIASSFEIGRV